MEIKRRCRWAGMEGWGRMGVKQAGWGGFLIHISHGLTQQGGGGGGGAVTKVTLGSLTVLYANSSNAPGQRSRPAQAHLC